MSFDPFSLQNCPIKPLNYHLPSITLTSGESFTLRTATEKSFSENNQRRHDNEKQLIQEVQRQMLPYLNNAQLKQLQGVLEGVLSGVELSHSAGMEESAKVDTVACFINAKRIEGCSEKP